jgi:hypothetical protein
VINVLDCFSGEGKIWNEIIIRNPDKKIYITSIEEKTIKNRIYLKGNNLKYLCRIDLAEYDIIDMDSYGTPYKQLETIKKRIKNQIIHLTYIWTFQGRINTGLLTKYGYSKQMIKKCPTLFCKKNFEVMKNYLARLGYEKIYYYNPCFNKYYIKIGGTNV